MKFKLTLGCNIAGKRRLGSTDKAKLIVFHRKQKLPKGKA